MQSADDFDGCWKEALDVYFQRFMQLLWPDIAEQIDWDVPHEFLDQELQKLVGVSETGVRRVDKLAKVSMLDGHERCFLIHIEIQGWLDADFAARVLTYYSRLRDRYGGLPVENLVVVTHGRHSGRRAARSAPRYRWRYRPRADSSPSAHLPGSHNLRYDDRGINGHGVVFYFSVVYLADWRAHWEDLKTIGFANPFALVIMAQLEAVATRDGRQRLARKVDIARWMYRCGYNAENLRQVLRMIDWLLRLPEELESEFNDVLQAIEAEGQMSYVTSFERVGERRGKKIGVQLGQSQVLHRLLTRKFGDLPAWVEAQLSEAGEDQLMQWAERVLDAGTLDEVFAR